MVTQRVPSGEGQITCRRRWDRAQSTITIVADVRGQKVVVRSANKTDDASADGRRRNCTAKSRLASRRPCTWKVFLYNPFCSRSEQRRLLLSSSGAPIGEALNNVKEDRSQQDSKQCHAQHPGEDGCSQSPSHLRSGPFAQDKWDNTKNEGE